MGWKQVESETVVVVGNQVPFGRDGPEREQGGGEAGVGELGERGEKGLDLGRAGRGLKFLEFLGF